MYSDHTPIPRPQAIFESARCFGLTEQQAWRVFDDTLSEVGSDGTIAEFLDEFSAALARRILSSERHSASTTARDPARRDSS